MRTNHLILSCFLLSAISCSNDAADTAKLEADLEQLVADEVLENDYLGLGVTVRLTDGRTIRAAAGGQDPTGTAYDVAGTEQVLGSATKLYTAVLVMQLVEEGLLALGDTIDRWVSFPGAERITVGMLLGHTSGLGEYLDHLSLEQIGQAWSPDDLLSVAIEAGPLGEPGMPMAIYTNTSFLVLGMIVERVTGRSWEQNVEERIAEPLGLEHTYYAGEDGRREHIAGGWLSTDEGWLDSLTLVDPSVGWGIGAMVSTNEELLRFATALFDGELFDSPGTLEQMMRFDTEFDPEHLGEGPPSTVGLGLIRMRFDEVQLEGHLGHTLGYNSCALRDPATGAVIVVTSNDDRAFAAFTAPKVARLVRAW